ncbi:MAG: hypothetical protein WCR95_00425 [Eubacteriales bacterium]
MIKLIMEAKGTGKTKALIEAANNAVAVSKGSVVFVEYGRDLSYQLKTQIRLVDAKAYSIIDADEFYGFVCGMLAGNYDVTDLFLDSVLKICGNDMASFGEFLFRIEKILDDRNINCLMTASAFAETLPAGLERFLVGVNRE